MTAHHPIKIRPLEKGDVAPIEHALRATGNFSDVEITTGVNMVKQALEPGSDDYEVVVAERDGGPLGYSLYGSTPFTHGTWDLYWIAVHPDAHGSGIGKTLLRAVEDDVRARGGRLVMIETSSRPDYEKARRLYDRGGYTLVVRIKDFYKDGDDKCVYACRVDRDAPVV